MRPLKIGISWVRGVVGETLAPELVVDSACAFGTFVDGAPLGVGTIPAVPHRWSTQECLPACSPAGATSSISDYCRRRLSNTSFAPAVWPGECRSRQATTMPAGTP